MASSPLPRRSASIALALMLMGGSACPGESTSAGAAARPGAPKQAARADDHPRFAPAGSGEVDAVVREAVVAATAERQRVVVYVGATWCEPCQDFHHAVERGELDQPLAGIRFVEFDSDHDGARLEAAGYGGRLIPRFVLPDAQGRGSEHRIEGGIKGSGAVAHIMERLGPLLASGSAPP
jgi:thiol-disulfide isomerase/thioredoxin